MSFELDIFSKCIPIYNSTITNSELNGEGLLNTYNENELNYSLLLEEEGEGPTNYKTDFKDVYSFERIKKIFQKYYTIGFKQILNNFIYDSHMEDAENRFMGKKRKRSYNYTTNIEGMKYSKRKGRKEKTDTSHRPHNKNTSDNIIKKIKSKYLNISFNL